MIRLSFLIALFLVSMLASTNFSPGYSYGSDRCLINSLIATPPYVSIFGQSSEAIAAKQPHQDDEHA